MTTELAEMPVVKQAKAVLYTITEDTIENLRIESQGLTIRGIDDAVGIATVKEQRMKCVRARTSIEKTRKELKAESLEYGRRVDAEAKRLTALVEPIEQRLLAEENKVQAELDRIAKEKSDKVHASRLDALATVGGTMPESVVRNMTDEEFAIALAEVDRQVKERKEREAREAAEAIERKRLADEAAKRQREEAEKIAAERAELDRQRREQEEAARVERERLDAIRREQEARQAELDAERKRIEEAEAVRQREIEAERQRQAKAERDRIEAEAKAKREQEEAEAKRQQEIRDRETAERKRPDREKLMTVADAVVAIEIPEVSDHAKPVANHVRSILKQAESEIREFVANYR